MSASISRLRRKTRLSCFMGNLCEGGPTSRRARHGLGSRERIFRIVAIARLAESHVACIDVEEAADETRSEADRLADRLQCHHRADHAGERAEHACLGAG